MCMTPALSITIPTYGRASYLRRCLTCVLPQVSEKPVEVVVIDNASPDETPQVISEFAGHYPNLRTYRNDANLGYAGNQAGCIEHAAGNYIAFLGDDDVYQPGAVDAILRVIEQKEYAFVGINYSGFIHNPKRPVTTHVAPVEDREFSRAFDIINHPSVGHYSGFVFNARLARAALADILQRHKLLDFERFRGILSELSVRTTVATPLPSYFIGQPFVGACMPLEVDYDSLQHICMDYYEWWLGNYMKGLINDADLAYRRQVVMGWLPKALYRNACYFDSRRLSGLREQLDSWFGSDPEYRQRVLPVLDRLKYAWVRLALRGVCECYKRAKPVYWRLRD